jgi:hypothetical protein
MMAALIAGGMTAAYSDERDQLAQVHADEFYQPNPGNKLFEIPLKEYGDINFPLAYQGNLIKVMLRGLDGLAVNPQGYRVVIMRRDPEEIRQSFEAFFGRPSNDPWMAEYEDRIQRAVMMLANRKDVRHVGLLDYEYLVSEPENALRALQLDIDSEAAAATIDPTQYRFRKELLTAGI